MASKVVIALAAAVSCGRVEAQSGSKYRCRDRHSQCKSWASTNQCSKNYPFMAESCPVACDFCSDVGLSPTPALYEMDLVCNGKLAKTSLVFTGAATDDIPMGCAFRCRDNSTLCATEAKRGACSKHPETMYFRCPAACGVCKALEQTPAKLDDYPRYLCDGPEEEKAECKGWVETGECISNYAFMLGECPHTCGFCATKEEGGMQKVPVDVALRKVKETSTGDHPQPRKPKKGKKKKKSKAQSGDAPADSEQGTPASSEAGEGKADGAEAASAAPAQKEGAAEAGDNAPTKSSMFQGLGDHLKKVGEKIQKIGKKAKQTKDEV